ncbi:MAG: helix-turn-helix transcriptional regulator [Bacillota bacterium]
MKTDDVKNTMRYPNIRYKMANQGLSIGNLSEKMGISYNALRGKLEGTSRFYLDEVKKISIILGIPIEQLAKEIN